MNQNSPLPGWYRDPTGLGDGRYWDGMAWTDAVSRAGQTITAPIDPQQAALPPVPGSEMQTPAVAPSAPAVTVNASNRSPVGAIVGILAIVAIVVLIFVLISNGDDSTEDDSPPATNAPTTEAPAEPTGDGG